MPRSNLINRETYHYKWSKRHKPALRVKPGEKVTFQVNEVSTWQLNRHSSVGDLAQIDMEKMYPLAGPVFVEGARPGDALIVEVLSVKPADWGWTAIIPGLGLLEEFDKPFLRIWDLKNGSYAPFKKGIRVPLKPFCGVYGVAPPGDSYFDVMPPGKHGGNMDVRHLTAGSRVRIPVWVEGGLFSTTDVHAAQGDGEVCVSAIECPGEVTLRLDIERNARIQSPHFWIKGDPPPKRGYYATTGIATDLWQASKLAVRSMIEHLQRRCRLTPEEAYVLCSVAGDLRVHEVVDKPNWVVGFTLSQDLFPSDGSR